MATSVNPPPVETVADEPFSADALSFDQVAEALDAVWFGRYKPQFYFRAIDDNGSGDEQPIPFHRFYLRPHFQLDAAPGDIAEGITLLTANQRGNLDDAPVIVELETSSAANASSAGPSHAKEIEILSWSWGVSRGESEPPDFSGTIDFADGTKIEFNEIAAPGLAMALHAATDGGPFDDNGKDIFVHISAVESSRGGGPAIYDAFAEASDGTVIGTVEGGDYINVIEMLRG